MQAIPANVKKSIKALSKAFDETIKSDRAKRVLAEYASLKTKSLSDLKEMMKRLNKVIDVSGVDKQSAISTILEDRHGSKAVKEAFDSDQAARLRQDRDDVRKELKEAKWAGAEPDEIKEIQRELDAINRAIERSASGQDDKESIKKRIRILETKQNSFTLKAPLRYKVEVAEELKKLRAQLASTGDASSKERLDAHAKMKADLVLKMQKQGISKEDIAQAMRDLDKNFDRNATKAGDAMGKEMTRAQIMAKVKAGEWELMTDLPARGRHVEIKTDAGKRIMVMVADSLPSPVRASMDALTKHFGCDGEFDPKPTKYKVISKNGYVQFTGTLEQCKAWIKKTPSPSSFSWLPVGMDGSNLTTQAKAESEAKAIAASKGIKMAVWKDYDEDSDKEGWQFAPADRAKGLFGDRLMAQHSIYYVGTGF